MTLIIDMASGTPCEDATISRTATEPMTDRRLDMPAVEPGLVPAPLARRASTAVMPASLRDRDIAGFLGHMD